MKINKTNQSRSKQVEKLVGYVQFIHPKKPLGAAVPFWFFLEDLASPDSESDTEHHFLNADEYLHKFAKPIKDSVGIQGLLYIIETAFEYIEKIQAKHPSSIKSLSINHNWLILEEHLENIQKGIDILNNVCKQCSKQVFSKKADDLSFTAREYAKRAITTLLLNRHTFKYSPSEKHPRWVEDCKSLPPFNKTSWKQWAKVARKMIHEEMPDIYKRPEWKNHVLRARSALGDGKIEGRMRGQIIDDITKAIKVIAISPSL